MGYKMLLVRFTSMAFARGRSPSANSNASIIDFRAFAPFFHASIPGQTIHNGASGIMGKALERPERLQL